MSDGGGAGGGGGGGADGGGAPGDGGGAADGAIGASAGSEGASTASQGAGPNAANAAVSVIPSAPVVTIAQQAPTNNQAHTQNNNTLAHRMAEAKRMAEHQHSLNLVDDGTMMPDELPQRKPIRDKIAGAFDTMKEFFEGGRDKEIRAAPPEARNKEPSRAVDALRNSMRELRDSPNVEHIRTQRLNLYDRDVEARTPPPPAPERPELPPAPRTNPTAPGLPPVPTLSR
jgi:hypothetical protein